MITYDVRLEDGTVGTITADSIDWQHADVFLGEIVRVHLHDENGNPIEREGRMVEVLHESSPWG